MGILQRLRLDRIAPTLVPGVALWRLGRRLSGAIHLLAFVAACAFIALHAGPIGDSYRSLYHTIALGLAAPEEFHLIFNSDVLQFWLAALVATALPLAVVYFARRAARRAMRGAGREESSDWRLAMSQFRGNRIARTGVVVLFLLYGAAVFSPFLAPYAPNAFQDGAVTQYLPPLASVTALRLKHERIAPLVPSFRFVPAAQEGEARALHALNERLLSDDFQRLHFVDAWHIESSDVVATCGTERVVIPIADLVSPNPEEFASTRDFLLGTDSFGRDVLSRLLFGARISLSLGFIAVLLSVTLGTVVGLSAGYFGRAIDSVLMRAVDVLLAFPSLFLILIVVAVFDTITFPRILLVVIVLGCTSWMGIARLVRGEVLSLKEQDFVLAARAAGLGHARIIFRHILPNAITPVIINATLRIGGMILIEAALSFLNLGVQQPTASWGSIILEGKDVLARAWWISTFPGLAIVFTVISFNLVGDGLRDAFDPRLISREARA